MRREKLKSNQKPLKGLMDLLDMKVDPPEARTVAAKRRIRDQLQQEMENFLNSGGGINAVSTGISGEIH